MVILLYEINIHVVDFFKGERVRTHGRPLDTCMLTTLEKNELVLAKRRLSQPLPAISLINFNGIKKSLLDGTHHKSFGAKGLTYI